MAYKIKVEEEAIFIHSRTMQRLNVKECREINCGDLEGMERVAEEYDIEVSVDSNSPDYEKKLVEAIRDKLKISSLERMNKMVETIKDVYLKDMYGIIEFGGYLLNLNEFCGVKIQRIVVDIKERI